MVFEQLSDLYQKIGANNRVGVEDAYDRLNLFTVILFALAAVVVGVKQYVLNDISCYIPVSPTGEKFNEFVNDYCWVRGTIPIYEHETLPDNDALWDEYERFRRINYYQWVPFVLGLQCILFYLPHLIWQSVCTKQAGGDLFSLIKAAAETATVERDFRRSRVKQVIEFIQDFVERTNGRKNHGTSCLNRVLCGFQLRCVRHGFRLFVFYLMHKILLILNAFLQLYLIQRFLGFYTEGSMGSTSTELGIKDGHHTEYLGLGFGFTLADHLYHGRDWKETMIFPRVAFCRIHGIHSVGAKNMYTAQCALPINMLNEKIYLFFWFWLTVAFAAGLVNLFTWLWASRRSASCHYIERFLRIKKVVNEKNVRKIGPFVRTYLDHDGLFIMRILSMNAGELVTSEILAALFLDYCTNPDYDDKDSNAEQSTMGDEKRPLNPPSPNDRPPLYFDTPKRPNAPELEGFRV